MTTAQASSSLMRAWPSAQALSTGGPLTRSVGELRSALVGRLNPVDVRQFRQQGLERRRYIHHPSVAVGIPFDRLSMHQPVEVDREPAVQRQREDIAGIDVQRLAVASLGKRQESCRLGVCVQLDYDVAEGTSEMCNARRQNVVKTAPVIDPVGLERQDRRLPLLQDQPRPASCSHTPPEQPRTPWRSSPGTAG